MWNYSTHDFGRENLINLMLVWYNVNINFSLEIFRYNIAQIFDRKKIDKNFNNFIIFYPSKFSILLLLIVFLLVTTQVGSIWSNIEMSQLTVIATSSSLSLDIIVTQLCITTNIALNNRVNSKWVLHNVHGSWSMHLVSHVLPSVSIV